MFAVSMKRPALALVAAACLAGLCRAEPGTNEPVSLGHRDFRPSAVRPVGFRGDGNGYFPGATPVREWWDGLPVLQPMPVQTRSGPSTLPVWCFENDTPKNVLWKRPLPGWSDAQPVVVHDRVFALCEPHFLVCVDLHTGTNLWQ